MKPLEDNIVIEKTWTRGILCPRSTAHPEELGFRYLITTGVITEVCVNLTVRQARYRGYECVVPADCVASYLTEFHKIVLGIIKTGGGLFSRVDTSESFIKAILVK